MTQASPSQYQLFADLTAAEYAALKADIAARGAILVPIELDEHGATLDGHNRLRAWRELRAEGVTVADYPRIVRAGMTEEAKRAHVLAVNLYRRHLTAKQRAPLVIECRRLGMTLAEIARLAGVHRDTVRQDQQQAVCGNPQTEIPKHVKGKDGKSYPTKKPRKAKTAAIFATTPRQEKQAIQAASTPEALPDGIVGAKEAATVVREQRREAAREATQAQPVPAAATLPARIEIADACQLPLEDGSVDLIVTSPPYGLDKAYGGIPDLADGWHDFMADWLAEAFRVTADGGRLALNVPLDTTEGGYRPTYAQAVSAACGVGWRYRFTIVWDEQNVSKSTARGSVDSPSAPHYYAPVEMVPVFYKGETWARRSIEPTDLTHADWLAWTGAVLWQFPGESRPWEGHPAPFPPELPRRLITLLSFPGDSVLDPFSGSGTTVLTAWRLGRDALGFDQSEVYTAAARRRLARAMEVLDGDPHAPENDCAAGLPESTPEPVDRQ